VSSTRELTMAPATSTHVPRSTRIHHPLVPRRLTVRRVTDLSPTLRRVALGGPALDGFAAHGPTDHVKVFFPDADGEVRMPVVGDGRWAGRDDSLPFRDFTVRTFGPQSRELVLEVAVHADGLAGAWAAQAAPGQCLGLLGPKSSTLPPLDRDWYLLVVDETGLPAVANWLDRLPGDTPVRVLAEVDGPVDEVPLPARAGTQVTWLHRDGAERGTTMLLPDAVASVLPDEPDGAGWLFAAGEATATRAIRAMARERGLGDSSAITGYWRRGVVHFDHHSPDA